MAFPTVVFGTASITAPSTITFTPGSSIPTGGYYLYILPTVNIGSAPMDIGFTYTNQYGVLKTTTVTTSVLGGTTSGTRIRVALNAGDIGIQSLIGINSFGGGTAGETLSFESWNEGTGSQPFDYTLSNPIDRSLPGTFLPEPIIAQFNGSSFDPSTIIPDFYISEPPNVVMDITGSNLVAFIPKLIIDRGIDIKDETVSVRDMVDWIPETLTRTITGLDFFIFKSWLESVVGQVVSGYITNTNNEIIANAIKLVLVSTTTADVDTITTVDPVTGLYQAAIKNVVYDQRYIIIKAGVKVASLEGGGTPTVVDGTQKLSIPYNIQFACPTVICDFDMTRKQ